MAHVVLMPALSPTMETGTLAKWLVKEGDAVSPGDVIAEIETDKATVELETDEEGVIVKLLVGDGAADIAINTPIAVIAEEGEDPDVDKLLEEAGTTSGNPEENAGDNAVEKPAASGAEPVEGGGGASASTMAATATGQHQVGSPAVAAAGGRIFA
ncbi:MAG TPA: biotin/lipoyl-binding protein, partial [Thermopetrobacter sp.]|nr:biotin/lipoyl-binding protein [Thermopetrobacter sp.]